MTHIRKNVIMGSFMPDPSLKKWQLISERDRIFDSYCDSLEKLSAWDKKGPDMLLGYDKNKYWTGLSRVKELIVNHMAELSEKLIELDERINELGHHEPPTDLSSHDDHTG